MKLAFGCDHGGFVAKEKVFEYLNANGHEVIDYGTFSTDSCNYVDFAELVSDAVAKKQVEKGILICGTGIGMSIASNKFKGVRCAHVTDAFSAEMTRRHNDTNVIALGARITSIEDIVKFIDIFLNTEFEGGRHEQRVGKICSLEDKNFK